MAHALQHVAWEPCLIERTRDRALESYAQKRQGFPNPSIGYFAPVSWLARALVDVHPEYGLLMHLEQSVADLVSMAVCQENSCRFCYAAVRALLWGRGMSMERIRRVEQDLARADLPAPALAAMALGRSQSRSGPAGARDAQEAVRRAGFSAGEMKEIAFTAAFTDFSTRAYTIPAIPTRPLEELPERFHMRLFRPLLQRILERHTVRGRTTPLDRAPSSPYARLVKSYDGSPIGPLLARTLEEMWASPHLTRRSKLLMCAVIARGLACQVCAPEVGAVLRDEGMPDGTLSQVLTHLDAPELDPVERLLVPFARDTIWYEPASLQRRARAVREHLSPPQFLEAIGVAALANGLCRLGAMVVEPE